MSKFGIYLTLPLFLLIFAACASATGPKGEAAQTANLANEHCHIFIDKRNILFPERMPVLLEINLHPKKGHVPLKKTLPLPEVIS